MVKNLKRVEKARFRSRNFLAQLVLKLKSMYIRVRRSSLGRLGMLGALLAYVSEQSIKNSCCETNTSGGEPDLRGQIKVGCCFWKEKRRHWPRWSPAAVESAGGRGGSGQADTIWVGSKLIANKFDGSKFAEV